MKSLTKQQVIELMKKQQGKRAAREYAEELGISAVYLSDIYNGRRDPGRSVLEALHLERDTVYRPAAEAEGLR